jgi:hypothetical protein
MMKNMFLSHRFRTAGVLLISLLMIGVGIVVPPSTSTAAVVSYGDACMTQINNGLAKEQRLFRRSLFGLRKAADEPQGAVHYDTEGNAWLKNGVNQWKSQAKGFESTTWSDRQMDLQVEKDPLLTASSSSSPFQKGIFEMKGVLTSELIPPITQSYRAFQCRTQALCESVIRSVQKSGGDLTTPLVITVPGCMEMKLPVLRSCVTPSVSDAGADPSVLPYADAQALTSIRTYCEPVAEAMLTREADLLKLSVSYDASYRSLLQFAGNFDDFLQLFQVDLMTPLEQATPLLKQLSRIPCFLSECSE